MEPALEVGDALGEVAHLVLELADAPLLDLAVLRKAHVVRVIDPARARATQQHGTQDRVAHGSHESTNRAIAAPLAWRAGPATLARVGNCCRWRLYSVRAPCRDLPAR